MRIQEFRGSDYASWVLVAKVLGARSSGRSADETEYGNFASDVSHQGPSGAAQEGFATEVWSVP